MQTKKTVPASSLEHNQLNIVLPRNWDEVTEEQLKYYFKMRAVLSSNNELQTCCFRRWAGIAETRQLRDGSYAMAIQQGDKLNFFKLELWQIQSAVLALNWISNEQPTEVICVRNLWTSRTAVDKYLRMVPFEDYLAAEGFYQGYLHTRKSLEESQKNYGYQLEALQKQNRDLLRGLAGILYPHKDNKEFNLKIEPWQEIALITWWYSLKLYMARVFSSLFKTSDSSDTEEFDFTGSINAQIRALTEGDVTKEAAVFKIDTHRALTELNEKAREASELRKRMKK